MSYGRVYLGVLDLTHPCGGRVILDVVPLLRLDQPLRGTLRLSGRFVRVRNGGALNHVIPATGAVRVAPIGNAEPNEEGDFVFDPGIGGGRIDKVALADAAFQGRYIQASHFGE